MIDPNLDGISHINIYSKANTELGRFLSNFSQWPISLPEGDFASIEGYWYFLGTKDNPEKHKLKYAYGFMAKKIGKEQQEKYGSQVCESFEDKICAAIKIKIDTAPEGIRQLLIANELPFEHYYVYGGKVVDAGFKWIVEFISDYTNKIRKE